MEDDGTDFPTDVLVYIFQRLQPNTRRRLRLVCRHWCHIVDTRTATSLSSRAKTLLVTVERLYVFDDYDLSYGQCSHDMPVWRSRYGDSSNEVVGTCNGIICMCDHLGGIDLHNPVTGDTLVVPNLPPRHQTGARIWHRTFSFTYDQATGRYMVVHVPHSAKWRNVVVTVFTLGEASWRDVVVPNDTHVSRCNPEDGFVTVDNTLYWAMEGRGGKVVSFDLDGKRGLSVIPLPSPRPAGTWRLTEVLGRIGIVFTTEVWVMERGASGEAKHARWSRWYSVQVRRAPHQPKWHDHQHLTWPHFAHGNKHVLTWEWLSTGGACTLYRHITSDDTTKARHGTVEIDERNQGTLIAHIETKYDTFKRFDYVETMEPLSIYKCW